MSLVAHYPLNGDIKDYSGHGRDMSVRIDTDPILYDDNGKIGKAFKGSGGQAVLDYQACGIDLRHNMSIAFWIKPLYIPPNIYTRYGVFHTHYVHEIEIEISENGALWWGYGASPASLGTTFKVNNCFSLNTWTHIVLIRDLTLNRVRVYRNGQLFGEEGLLFIPTQGDYPLVIGKAVYNSWFNGHLNDFRIYDHVLSNKEIEELSKAKILHYTFDDLEEPTINQAKNPDGSNINPSYVVPGVYAPGWDIGLHSDAIVVHDWSSGYNGGVSSSSTGYHARWVYKDSGNANPCMLFQDENDIYGLGHRWLGISQSIGVPSALGWGIGTVITISWDQMANVIKGGNVGLYHRKVSTASYSFESNIQYIPCTVINQWERVSFTTTISSDWDLMAVVSLYVYGHNGSYGKLWIDNVQVEVKDHMTPFVVGERTADILDYSGYNNHQAIDLTYSPKWISDSAIGSGGYEFFTTSKISTGFSINSNVFMQPLSSFTLVCWIKLIDPLSAGQSSLLVGSANNSGFGIMAYENGLICGYLRDANGTYQTPKTAVSLNEWHHVALVMTRNSVGMGILSFVIDGVGKIHPYSIVDGNFAADSFLGINESKAVIPAEANTVGSHFAIDDIKIMMRAFDYVGVSKLYQTRGALDNEGNLFVGQLLLNGIGSVSNNKIAYHNWEEGDYSSATKTFVGDLPSHSMTFAIDSNFTTKISKLANPVDIQDRVLEYRVKTTHYAQYAHPTSYYYFTMDKTKTYRYSQWIYRHAEPSSSYASRCYLGIQGSTVCNLNTTTANTNPYFTTPLINDSKYRDKWVLQVFYIYPYGSVGNPTGGKLYYLDGSSVSDGIAYNWNNSTASHIRQYPMYEYGEIAANSFVLQYRPRLDVVDGTEPTIEELLSCGEHLSLIGDSYEKHGLTQEGVLSVRDFSEIGITKGLIAHYSLNGDTEDYSGNNFHGTNYGSSIVGGLRGICYSFDGIDDYVNISGYGLDHPSSYKKGATFSCWVKTTIASGIARFVCGFHYLTINAQGNLQNMVYNSATQANYWLQGNTVINTGNWVNVVFTIEKGIGVKYYVNGVLDASYEDSGIDIISYSSDSAFGATYNGFFEGLMEDLRIYDRALTSEEIAINYDIYNPSGSQMKITKDCFYTKGQIKEGY